MNLIYIHSHDTGRYIQPYGHPVETPRLQAFAEEGALFRQAHSVVPTCSPSRACLLTGRYAHQNGMFGLAHFGWRLNDYHQHLSHVMRSHGYHTALYGVQHEGALGDLGYACYSPLCDRDEELATWTGEQLGKPGSAPFFLSIGFGDTHRPFPELDAGETANHTMPPARFPDTPETREDFARFKKMAGHLDRRIGVVLDALEVSGREDETLVLITTDHGIPFPEMKCNLTEDGTGVMLLLRGPGVPVDWTSDALVSHLDVLPTLFELMALPTPEWLEGHSLVPLLRGTRESIRDEVFTEMNWHGCWEPMRAVRTPRYRYIRRLGARCLRPLVNCDASPTKEVLLAAGWCEKELDPEELYDLLLDPGESRNLAYAPSMKTVLDDLRGRLQAWQERTNDPLLRESWIKPPPGAVTFDPDDTDPSWDDRWQMQAT